MRWIIAAILILLVALTFQMGLLAYAMYALIGVILISRWTTKAWATSLDAKRTCNQYEANVGQTIAVVIAVKNTGRLPIAWVLLEDLLPRDALMPPRKLEVKGSRLQVAHIKPGGSKSMLYQLEFKTRGYFQLGPLIAETGDLFGLHRRFLVATDPHYVLVYPEVIPIEGFDIASRRPIGEVRMSYRLFEDPTRIAGTRDYQAGDPLNRVHWKATARTGMLQSKVLEPSTVAGATLFLDFDLRSHDPKHEPIRSELSVTLAASLANALYEMNQQVGLVTNGRDAADRVKFEGWAHDYRSRDRAMQDAQTREKSDRLEPLVVETRRGPDQFMRIRETLARVELTDGLDVAGLVHETASRMPRDATVLCILPDASPEAAIALGNLRRRGFAVEAIVNTYYEHDFEKAAGRLAAQGITSRHLRDRDGIADLCRHCMTGMFR